MRSLTVEEVNDAFRDTLERSLITVIVGTWEDVASALQEGVEDSIHRISYRELLDFKASERVAYAEVEDLEFIVCIVNEALREMGHLIWMVGCDKCFIGAFYFHQQAPGSSSSAA